MKSENLGGGGARLKKRGPEPTGSTAEDRRKQKQWGWEGNGKTATTKGIVHCADEFKTRGKGG